MKLRVDYDTFHSNIASPWIGSLVKNVFEVISVILHFIISVRLENKMAAQPLGHSRHLIPPGSNKA